MCFIMEVRISIGRNCEKADRKKRGIRKLSIGREDTVGQ